MISGIPQRIWMYFGRAVYTGILLLVKSYLFITSLPYTIQFELWPRNSFLTQSFSPFKSDLDLTLWIRGERSRQKDHWLRSVLGVLTRFRLLPGEMNVYFESTAEEQSQFANAFELTRDPVLLSKLKTTQQIEVSAAHCFLLRMLENDAGGLLNPSPRSQKKWASYLNQVSEFVVLNGKISQTTILSLIVDYNHPRNFDALKQEAKDTLLAFLEHKGRTHSTHTFYPQLWLSYYFPHRGCGAQLTAFPPFLPIGELFFRQLEWEIWGIQCQQHQIPPAKLLQHVTAIRSLLTEVSTPRALQLNAALIQLETSLS